MMSMCKDGKCLNAIIRTVDEATNKAQEKIECMVLPIGPNEIVTACSEFEDKAMRDAEEKAWMAEHKAEKEEQEKETPAKSKKTRKKSTKQGEKS